MVTRCLRIKEVVVLVYFLNHGKEVFCTSLLCFGYKGAMRNKFGAAAVFTSSVFCLFL